ncbi:MAG: ribbon-helix-helix domain-containing protein [Sulfuriferula sp.]
MEDSIRWTIKVSKGTDISLRSYLAQHGMKKGDLSKFVEEAVRWRVLNKSVAEVRERNASVTEGEIEAAIDEALAAVRADMKAEISAKLLNKK